MLFFIVNILIVIVIAVLGRSLARISAWVMTIFVLYDLAQI